MITRFTIALIAFPVMFLYYLHKCMILFTINYIHELRRILAGKI